MPKKAKNYNVALMQPTELNELNRLVKEFVSRVENIDNEISLLKEDRKSVIEEYSDRIDMKTLNSVLRVLKIESTVAHKDTYDNFYEALQKDGVDE